MGSRDLSRFPCNLLKENTFKYLHNKKVSVETHISIALLQVAHPHPFHKPTTFRASILYSLYSLYFLSKDDVLVESSAHGAHLAKVLVHSEDHSITPSVPWNQKIVCLLMNSSGINEGIKSS